MKSFRQYLTEQTVPINVGAATNAIDKVLYKFALKPGTYESLAKTLKPLGKKYLFNVNIRKAPGLDSGDMSVWGFYDPIADKDYVSGDGEDDLPIELIILFSPKDKKLNLSPSGSRNLARALGETLAHEWIHLKQARARNWKSIKPKKAYLHKVENVEVGSYLANDDEIEAHALTISLALKNQFHTTQERINFLQRPKNGVLADHHFDMYIKIFGMGHPVVKRLFKKIVGYLK